MSMSSLARAFTARIHKVYSCSWRRRVPSNINQAAPLDSYASALNFVLILYVQVNNFTVMSGRVFLG